MSYDITKEDSVRKRMLLRETRDWDPDDPPSRQVPIYTYNNSAGYERVRRISYDRGPKYGPYGCVWKRCESYREQRTRSGDPWTVSWVPKWLAGSYPNWRYQVKDYFPNSTLQIWNAAKLQQLRSEAVELRDKAMDSLWEMLDLNARDRVMGYSYALDMLPFVGAATRVSSVLNKALKSLVRRFGSTSIRKNIYECIRLLISGDLINRFVIQTTINDTRAIMSVFERCRQTWEIANYRNQSDFVNIEAGPVVFRDKLVEENKMISYADGRAWYYHADYERGFEARVSMCLRAKVRYNLQEADPIRWVAHALGIDTPFESVWDKIPFSFVCDYFFRVGEFIQWLGDRAGQDGLRAKVASVAGLWAQEVVQSYALLRNPHGFVYEPGQVVRPVYDWKEDSVIKLSGNRYYRRFPLDFSPESGFWDKGGLWSPTLSSVRKRTLLELAIQFGGGRKH